MSSIHHLEPVVWKMGNGDCLHQGSDVCQNKDNSGKSQPLTDAGRPLHSMCRPSEHNIGECMVEAEVSMRHEIQCDGNLQHHEGSF